MEKFTDSTEGSLVSNPTPPSSRDAGRAHRTLAGDLRDLASKVAGRRASLGELLAATQGRGFDLFLVFIALPFLSPVPLLGLSTPFGMVVCLIGARLALGLPPWLPRRLMDRTMPPGFLSTLLKVGARIVALLERLLKPRLVFLQESTILRRVSGVLIMVSGLLLLLPMPVPLSNFFPALTVVLLAAGALERDGVCFIAGSLVFVATLGFFALLGLGGAQAFDSFHSVLRADPALPSVP